MSHHDCSGCGLCLLVCPVWRQSRDVRFTPKGRARAIQHGASREDVAASTAGCTLCGACEPACPEELPLVLAPILADRADFVLGARRLSGRHPGHAAFGTRLVAGFISWRYGRHITDIGPFRAIRAELFRRLGMRDRAFGWPAEMVVKAAALGARIEEVPVSHGPRLAGESKVSGTIVGSARAGYGFLRAALRAARDVR